MVAGWVSAAVLLLSLLSSNVASWASDTPTGVSASQQPEQKNLASQAPAFPVRSVDLQPFDFRPISPLRSRDGAWHLSIDFLDENRLLATFEGNGVMRRMRNCPKTHDDRMVHAVLLDAKTGAVLKRADWYLHDRRRYLWPLASGKLLLRRADSLYELDGDLREKPVLEHTDLYWLDITPDGQKVLVGTVAKKADDKADSKSSPKFETRVLDSATWSVIGTFPADRPIPVQATTKGYADVVLKSGWTWLVRFGGQGRGRVPITRVRSTCIPDLNVSSESTLLIGRCTQSQQDYVVSSFTTAGQFLWRRRWQEQLTSPTIRRSNSGARFALASVEVDRQNSTATDEEGGPEVRRHHIEVFNSASGTSALKLETQPAINVGGNFALSPEGATLVLLRDSHLEIYSLPKLDKDELAKLAAVRAGTPGLIPPPPNDPDAGELPDDDLAPENQPAVSAVAGLNSGQAVSGGAAGANTAVPPTNATPGTPADASTPVFRSRSEAVVVDVVVTDSKGRPIPGLKLEEFSVQEDGAPQKLSFFEEHSFADTRQAPPPDFKRPPNIFTNVSNTSQPDSATLILLDLLNTSAQDQASARDALTRYIKRKPKNESFALCVLAGPLRLIRGFTTDENELLLAMLDKRAKPSASLISQLDTASLNFIRSVAHKLDNPNDIGRSFAIAMAGLERTIEDEQMSQNDMRTYLTISAFEELARYMAGVPGRKKILWLSAAFPLGQFASAQGLDAGPFHQQRNFLRLVSKTMNLLASAHVSVYPVDVRGVMLNSISDVAAEMPFTQTLPTSPLSSPSGMSQQVQAGGIALDANAASSARNMANDHASPGDGFVGRGLEDSVRRNSEHNAMDLIAEQTGGKAFYGSNDITDALRTVVDQGSDYYTLSYTPTNRKYDGRFRKIRVNVAGKKYRIAHRSGYYAEDPNRLPEKSEGVQRSLTTAGMMHGAPESRQIPFQVRVVPMGEPRIVNAADLGIRQQKNAPSQLRLQHYTVDFAISAGSLRFDPGPEGNFHGSFRLLANSFDHEGKSLLQAASSATAELRPGNYHSVLAEGFRLKQELDIPADAGFLRLGVGDLTNNSIGTLELPLPVPIPQDDPSGRKEKALPPVEPE